MEITESREDGGAGYLCAKSVTQTQSLLKATTPCEEGARVKMQKMFINIFLFYRDR